MAMQFGMLFNQLCFC